MDLLLFHGSRSFDILEYERCHSEASVCSCVDLWRNGNPSSVNPSTKSNRDRLQQPRVPDGDEAGLENGWMGIAIVTSCLFAYSDYGSLTGLL